MSGLIDEDLLYKDEADGAPDNFARYDSTSQTREGK